MGDWDWAAAERSLQRALELNPSNSWAHGIYGLALTYLARFPEAIAHFERARQLDPLGTGSATEADLGRLYDLTGQREKAFTEWNRILALDPDNAATHRHMGNSYCERGEYERGIRLLERAMEITPRAFVVADLGHCFAISGNRDSAVGLLQGLQEASEERYISPMTIALVQIGLGERDAALDSLERAFEVRAVRTPSIAIDERFEPLYAEPRFQTLLERVGLYKRAGGLRDT